MHYVFVPIINQRLALFAMGHNRGPISTEQNRSPQQLWIRGMLSNQSTRIGEELLNQVGVSFFIVLCEMLHHSTLSEVNDGIIRTDTGFIVLAQVNVQVNVPHSFRAYDTFSSVNDRFSPYAKLPISKITHTCERWFFVCATILRKY